MFLLPNFLGFALFSLLPLGAALILSFFRWDSANPAVFIGLRNIFSVFGDSTFRISFLNTLYYTFAVVPLIVLVSIVLALVLNEGGRGIFVFRAIFFFPHIASIVAAAVVWQYMFNPDFGPINSMLRFIGIIHTPRWIASSEWAMPSVIIVSVWKYAGYYMVIYLAALKGIPQQYYEAAKIDGASFFQKMRYITFPGLSHATFFVVVMSIINSFKVFTLVYVMTEGGPGRATNVLVYTIYTEAFVNLRFGYASAIALILFFLMFSITLIQFSMQKKLVYYV